MSRVLSNAMVGRAFAQIGVQNERLPANLPPMDQLDQQKSYRGVGSVGERPGGLQE